MSNSTVVDFDFIDTRIDTEMDLRGGFAGFATAVLTLNEIEMTSLKQVVEHILKNLRPNQKVGALSIYDHGSVFGQEFGSDCVSYMFLVSKNLGKLEWRQHLLRLKGRFAKDGYILLAGCKVGQSMHTMMEISKLTGAPVFAGTGNTTSSGFNTGYYVVVDATKTTTSYRYDTGSPSVEALNKGTKMPMNKPAPRVDMFDKAKMTATNVKIVFKILTGS